VLDHAQDYSWAIVGDPTGKYLWLFSRQPAVSPVVRSVMLARARTLGYDTAKLEFPQEG
jgi:apolipoprotein D and lipocalin family protein